MVREELIREERRVFLARPDNLSQDIRLAGSLFNNRWAVGPPIKKYTIENALLNVHQFGCHVYMNGKHVEGLNLSLREPETETLVVDEPTFSVSGPCTHSVAFRGRSNFCHLLLEGLPNVFECVRDIPKPILADNLSFLKSIASDINATFYPHCPSLFLTSECTVKADLFETLRGLSHPINVGEPAYVSRLQDVAQSLGGTSRFGPKIAILRRQGRRGVENYEAVAELLENRGFSLIAPEELSLHEQIRAFRDAETIVAVHGAALAAMAFNNNAPQTKIIELLQTQYLTPAFWIQARVMGFQYSMVVENRDNDRSRDVSTKMRDLIIDVDALKALL